MLSYPETSIDPFLVIILSFLHDSFQTEKVQDDGSKPVSAVKQGSNLPIKEQKRKSFKRNDTNSEFNK